MTARKDQSAEGLEEALTFAEDPTGNLDDDGPDRFHKALAAEVRRLRASSLQTPGGPEVDREWKLPCEVRLPNGMTIGKGVHLHTLLVALKRREVYAAEGLQHMLKFPRPPRETAVKLHELADAVAADKTPLDSCYSQGMVDFLRAAAHGDLSLYEPAQAAPTPSTPETPCGKAVVGFADDLSTPAGWKDRPCQTGVGTTRVCQRGTQGCDVDHPTPSTPEARGEDAPVALAVLSHLVRNKGTEYEKEAWRTLSRICSHPPAVRPTLLPGQDDSQAVGRASDGAIYEAVSRRDNPDLHAQAEAVVQAVGRALDSNNSGNARSPSEPVPLTGWRPIESAPRDKAVLICFARADSGGGETNPGICVAYQDAYYQSGGDGFYEGCSGWVIADGSETTNLHYSGPPTHWMPLPAPPTTTGG